ncbi:MAG: acyl-homoserine-lactone synthase [Caulobacteraceae bacterium]
MIDVVTLETAHLFGDALPEQHRFRFRQFVQRDGWQVPHFREMEYDQFDTPAAVYLLWRDVHRKVRGMVRLIPTTEPYMVEQLWDFLAPDEGAPRAADVWENTRFAVDRKLPPSERRQVMGELILASLEFGLINGVGRYLLVSPLWVLNGSLSAAGLTYSLLKTTDRLGPRTVATAYVPVSPEMLACSREALGVRGSVINPMPREERWAA